MVVSKGQLFLVDVDIYLHCVYEMFQWGLNAYLDDEVGAAPSSNCLACICQVRNISLEFIISLLYNSLLAYCIIHY